VLSLRLNVLSLPISDPPQRFKKFDNTKQLACHAGVAPFKNSSGASLQSRPRVSSGGGLQKAHKGIKATLSNSVMSAMRYNTHFKAYYERKLKEGKNRSVEAISLLSSTP
jgi:transposase